MSPGLGILWALMFSVPIAFLSMIRDEAGETWWQALLGNFCAITFVLFFVDSITFEIGRPMMTLPGLVPVIAINLVVALIVAACVDGLLEGFDAAAPVALVALAALLVVYVVGHNSGHNAYKASHLASVVTEPTDQLPASSTSNLVIVSPGIATNKASQAMSSGVAGQRNYSTYLHLGPATLQYVAGHMWYVFQLEFDGAINKHRLHSVEPGYIMVSGEDPNAPVVEHYDGPYSMIVSIGAGQGGQPDRWAYDHGYRSYLLDDPTLEINDQGEPFFTITLLQPRLGWTFNAPVGVLLINAHTGQITRYNLNDVPSWVDRVFSSNEVQQIAGWYGQYDHAPFGQRGNTNQYQVSGSPLLVYTGGENPSWRMLLTSYGSDTSVYRIVEMNSHTGALRIYTPQQPMGIESTLTGPNGSFTKPSGQGASNVFANHYQPTDLALHVIYGHLTWMVTYESGGSSSTFEGIGFVDAYHATANNVAFGSSKSAALQAYLTQLASEGSANGNNPGGGGTTRLVTGTVAPNGISWDVTAGQKYWYITLKGDPNHVYVGTVSALGPALAVAQPGDPVVISVLKVTLNDSTFTMQSFTDKNHSLQPAGS